MDNSATRNCNVRGLNFAARQRFVRGKIDESQCAIICLQETKCPSIDARFIRTWCPRRFDQFAYVPSIGASGGLITIWNSSLFEGVLIDTQQFGLLINFISKLNVEA